MTEDFYDLLDVPRDASQDEIKEAFREQVRIYHPDLNDDDRARAQFTALKKAHDVLEDPVERRAYDRLGHQEYVAKRTSGIPSPDRWKTTGDDDDAGASGGEESGSSSREAKTESSSSSSGVSSGRSGGSTASTSRGTGATSRKASASAGSTARTTGAASRSASTTDPAGEGTNRAGTSTASRSAGAGDGKTATAGSRERDRSGAASDRGVLQWLRERNVAWPLIWTAALTYLAGLLQFGLENGDGLRRFADALAATGGDPAALEGVLAGGRYGIDTPAAFVAGVEPVAPPLPPTQWYAALAGVVGLTLVVLGVSRVVGGRDLRGPISIAETIAVALAAGAAAVLLGGPLLAGAVLMPLLFGVIVHRTRRLPGWSPSYAYVAAVAAPGVALAAGAAGYGSLPTDVLAALVGLLGALGLALRAGVRIRFGR